MQARKEHIECIEKSSENDSNVHSDIFQCGSELTFDQNQSAFAYIAKPFIMDRVIVKHGNTKTSNNNTDAVCQYRRFFKEFILGSFHQAHEVFSF